MPPKLGVATMDVPRHPKTMEVKMEEREKEGGK
jgi:hypothetical protein